MAYAILHPLSIFFSYSRIVWDEVFVVPPWFRHVCIAFSIIFPWYLISRYDFTFCASLSLPLFYERQFYFLMLRRKVSLFKAVVYHLGQKRYRYIRGFLIFQLWFRLGLELYLVLMCYVSLCLHILLFRLTLLLPYDSQTVCWKRLIDCFFSVSVFFRGFMSLMEIHLFENDK